MLAASGLLFVIACSNVANLILARTVRRETELDRCLTPLAARRSHLLCGSGALAGVAIAAPMVFVLARYAARFSVRALDLTLDSSMVWIGVTLALVAAVFLAFVPRLPSANVSQGLSLASAGVRFTGSSRRRLRIFSITQITASFLLLALLISGVGVAGVQAFSVSGRTREFGIRLALGAQPRSILTNVLLEGLVIGNLGVITGIAVGCAFLRGIGKYIPDIQQPGTLPLLLSAIVILLAAVGASALPALRAARIDAVQALRAE